MERLYKYLGPNRTDVLRDGRIRYTQPSLFNDPFESRPHVVGVPPAELMERVSRVEAERLGVPEEDRVAILEMMEDPRRQAAASQIIIAIFVPLEIVRRLNEPHRPRVDWSQFDCAWRSGKSKFILATAIPRSCGVESV